MNCVNHLVTESLPGYLKGLPIPNSVLGWFSLSVGDWARLIPFGAAVGGLSYLSLQGLAHSPVVGPFLREKLTMLPGMQEPRVNSCIKMDCAKVVDTLDIEDLGDKAVLCRCWKSKKFPYCDGSHAKHNSLTGDNVGPLIIKKAA